MAPSQTAAIVSEPPRPAWRSFAGLAVMLCGPLMIGMTFSVVAPILPSIAANLAVGGNGALLAQMVMTVPALGIIISGPVTGAVARRLGAQNTLLLCFVGVGVCGSVALLIANAWVLLASRALLGVAAMGCATSAIALIGEHYDGEIRAKLIGLVVAVASGGSAVSVLVAGWVADHVGWRAPFSLYLLALILAVAGATSLRGPSRPATDVAGVAVRQGNSGVIALWPIYVAAALLAIPLNMPGVQVGFQLADDHIAGAFLISVVVAAFSVSLTLAAAAFGHVRRVLGVTRLIAVGLMFLGLGFVGVSLSHAAWPTALCCVFAGIGAGLLNPVLTVMLVERALPTARDEAIGVLNSAFFAGELFSPLILIPLRGVIGVHGLFGLLGAVLASGGLLISAFGRKAGVLHTEVEK